MPKEASKQHKTKKHKKKLLTPPGDLPETKIHSYKGASDETSASPNNFFPAREAPGELPEASRSSSGAVRLAAGLAPRAPGPLPRPPGPLQERFGAVFGFIFGSLPSVFLCFLGGSLR